jgi:glycosyltransferase involved in cell wall biosynthesis
LKIISAKYQLHLLCIADNFEIDFFNKTKTEQMKAYKTIFESVDYVYMPKKLFYFNFYDLFKYILIHILYRLPLIDLHYFSFDAVKKAKEIIKKYKINYLECHHLHTSFFKRFINIPATLVNHNLETELNPFENLSTEFNYIKRILWKLIGIISNFNSKKIETNNLYKFKAKFFISKNDMKKVDNSCPKIYRPITFKINKDEKIFNNDSFYILWIGGFDWEPNKDAIIWFSNEIYPKIIKSNLSNYTFHFIGRNPPLDLIRIADNKRFIVHNFVNDIKPFLLKADCLFVPLRKGSGIRVKIIEAMSYGIPIISTSKGCEGIYCKDILISDTPNEMINNLILLSKSITLRFELYKKEKDFLLSYHNEERIYEEISKVYT